MTLHGFSLIGGHLSPGTTETFRAVSPLDNAEVEPAFHLAGAAEVDAALGLAESAFAVYRETTGWERAALLENIADELLALGETLIARAHLETGLPEGRLLVDESR